MKEDLLDIRNAIAENRFADEAAVSSGVVRRILHALSWPIFNTKVVWPEYPLKGRRVDFALCLSHGQPAVVIEVKRTGNNTGADEQLFEYAFHSGVPMAILTDGREWHFFLPAELGTYGDRRVYMLDILERDLDESVNRLKRYLDYQAVCSGKAFDVAREDYRNVAKERQIQETLPEAWTKLVGDEDEYLLDALASKVESLCGFKPDPDTVASFLKHAVKLRTARQALNESRRAVGARLLFPDE